MEKVNDLPTIVEEIASRFRIVRTAIGLTQLDVAEELGITHQQVQKYEKAANRIPATAIYHLSIKWNVPITEFFPGFPHEIKGGSVDKDTLELVQIYNEIISIDIKKRLRALMGSIANDRKIS